MCQWRHHHLITNIYFTDQGPGEDCSCVREPMPVVGYGAQTCSMSKGDIAGARGSIIRALASTYARFDV